MRFLHTADWHLGRNIRGRSRVPEFEAVLAELVDIAVRERVEAVIVAGDIWDSNTPAPESDRLLFRTLRALVEHEIQVLLVAGNHDSPRRLEAMGQLAELVRVYTQHRVRRHDDGGVLTIAGREHTAQIAAIPWVQEGRIVDAAAMLGLEHENRQTYAEQAADVYRHMTQGFTRGHVHILTGHLFVDGAQLAAVDGSERRLHIDRTYGVMAESLPSSPQYVALGHVHQPQIIRNAPAPTAYAGSLLQLDFGERGQQKVVRLIDAIPDRPVELTDVPLAAGRPLAEVSGSLEAVLAAGEAAGDAWLRVVLEVERPEPGLAQRVREELPNAVDVRLFYERDEEAPPEADLGTLSPEELFVRYYQSQRGAAPAPQLLALFRELSEEREAEAVAVGAGTGAT